VREPVAEPGETGGDAGIERTLTSLEELHVRHYREMPHLARLSRRATGLLAEPVIIGLLFAAVALWILANTQGYRFSIRPFDPYPFPLLGLIGTIFALLTTLLILATQSRENRLEEQRSHLTLQLAALSEQKTAKVIALLEEMRRDSPHLASRPDPEAEALAAPTDTNEAVERFVEAQKAPE
jgi:uncharacterized membrane protein